MRSVSLSLTGIGKARKSFDANIVNRAIDATLNKLAAKAKIEVNQEIRKTYNIRKSDLDPVISISKSKPGAHEAEIRATGPRLPLIYFDAEQTTISGGDVVVRKRFAKQTLNSERIKARPRRLGVTVKVRKDRGRKLVLGSNRFGAFVAAGRNGNVHVFMREEKKTWKKSGSDWKRTKIDKRTSLSVPDMLGRKATAVKKVLREDAAKIFEQELNRARRHG
jgi:hypothetical protein